MAKAAHKEAEEAVNELPPDLKPRIDLNAMDYEVRFRGL